MREIDLVYRTMFAELGQRCLDAQFVRDFRIEPIDASFTLEGSFFKTTVKNRDYWYHQRPAGDGGRRKIYVGPVSDAEITRRVEEFGRLKDDVRSRRKLVSTLIREAGLPAPERFAGDVVAALAAAGLFRLRGVLIGTVAFQCYSGLLGVRLPASSMQTGDTDFAQFHSVSIAVDDTMPPVLDVLREVDPDFREVPSRTNPRMTTQFETRNHFRVEFLTPNTGRQDYEDKPSPMPALGGASAQPLRFLDFLIHQPVRSVMLHGSGISVLVPSPERYAVHKLIVASRRRHNGGDDLKREKDLRQAGLLMEALIATRRQVDLAGAYAEAWERGAAWRDAISRGLSSLPDASRYAIGKGLTSGLDDLGENPAEFALPLRAG